MACCAAPILRPRPRFLAAAAPESRPADAQKRLPAAAQADSHRIMAGTVPTSPGAAPVPAIARRSEPAPAGAGAGTAFAPAAITDEGSRQLLDRFAAGDDAAFADLVAAHQQLAYLTAWRILGEAEAARDATQEAFLRLFRHHESYDRARPFRTWLLSIVRNAAIDALRRQHRHEHPDHLERVAAPLEPVPMEGAELRQRVAAILDELPAKYRDIIVMREMEGMPADAIAQQIGVDYSTTRWRLHHARHLFRSAWLAHYGTEG
jgi:RNA polymerase sigma-70 factor (ECF subfamily)